MQSEPTIALDPAAKPAEAGARAGEGYEAQTPLTVIGLAAIAMILLINSPTLPGWAAPQPWQIPAPAGYGAPAPAKKLGPPLWLGVTGMSIGLAAMVVSFVLLIWPAVDTLLNSEPLPTPTT